MNPSPPPPLGVPSNPGCERCGRAEAHQVGDVWICDDCYIACGSCCAGDDEEES